MIDWLHSLIPNQPISAIWSMIIVPVVVVIAGLLVDNTSSARRSDGSTKHSDSRNDPPQ